ncbi:MAG TPA: hypothetical protein VGY57_05995 [Vicinamibacterales bacterium]|nr:hypothetical protein [Vicinamibacterales bacterium]
MLRGGASIAASPLRVKVKGAANPSTVISPAIPPSAFSVPRNG